jgi:pimeloyl-ACP methyl ester carboxylesterase
LEAGRDRAGIEPVALVPGLGALGYLLDTLYGCAAWTRAFLLDVPGFGYRGPRPCRAELPDLVNIVTGWLRTVPEHRVVLFGHSTGAQIALRAATAAPESVAALVLAGPTLPPALRRLSALAAAFTRKSRYEPLGLILVTWPYYLRGGSRELLRYVRSAQRDEPERLIGAVSCPVLVLRGRHDAFAPEPWVAQLAASTRNGRLVTTPGAHTFPYRHGGLTAALIADAASSDDAG